jgi:hypothetical protein
MPHLCWATANLISILATTGLYGCASSALLVPALISVQKAAPVNVQIPKPLRTPETPTDDAILELIQGAMKAASAGIMRDEKAVAAALGLEIQPSKIIAGIPALDLDTTGRITYNVNKTASTRYRWGLAVKLNNHPVCLTYEKIMIVNMSPTVTGWIATMKKSKQFSLTRALEMA